MVKTCLAGLLVLTLMICSAASVCAADEPEVILFLKSGDRLTGKVLSEDPERIVLSTPWNVAIFVPKSEIERQEVVNAHNDTQPEDIEPPVPDKLPQASSETPAVAAKQIKPAPSEPPKKPSPWKWNAEIGFNLVSGTKNTEQYYGKVAATFAKHYQADPKRYLRNKIEYRVNYGKSDDVVSANRMVGRNKLDLDIGPKTYTYGIIGAGYDAVRKIDLNFEVGPGVGYHVLQQKKLVLNGEVGLNYQLQALSNTADKELLQLRVAQQFAWEIVPRVKLDQKLGILPSLNDVDDFQIRAEARIVLGVVAPFSVNFSVINLYDTQPAPGVPSNEFQFRSTLGVNF